jgi:hypothetical protein
MATLKLDSGDLFAIPTHNANGIVGYVVGRNIAAENNGALLIEVFKGFYDTAPDNRSAIAIGERLFRPILFLPVFGLGMIPAKEKWPILFNDACYNRSESDYPNIEIAYPAINKIWKNGVEISASPARIATVERARLWTPIDLSRRVAGHLAGRIGATEQYDDWQVVGLDKGSATTAMFQTTFFVAGEEARKDSHIIAARFKEWAAMKKIAQKKLPPGKK